MVIVGSRRQVITGRGVKGPPGRTAVWSPPSLPVTDGGFVRTPWQKSSEGVRAETELSVGYRLEQG